MAIAYNAKIITSNLVLCLDALNPKSYSGSGTTWSDISGKGNNATLTGSASHVTWNSGGYFTHNTGDTYFGASASNTTASTSYGGYWVISNATNLSPNGGSWSICGWAKPNGDQSNNGGGWFHKQGGGDERQLMAEFIAGNFRVNGASGWSQINHNIDNSGVWQYISITYKTNGIYGSAAGNLNYYINGALIATLTGFYPVVEAGGPIWLGRRNGHLQHFFKGDLAMYQYYTQELTASEITQNYNAHKSRFGL